MFIQQFDRRDILAKTYKELLEEDFARQIEFNNIKKYHEAGYKGKGIVIFNSETLDDDHGRMTTKVINDYAPEATVINGHIEGKVSGSELIDYGINIEGKKYSFEEAIEKIKIKIFTYSYSGSVAKAVLDYFKELQNKYGVIFFTPAGNEPDHDGMWSKHDTAITVSACKLRENGDITISYYGSKDEVDFTMFMAKGRGTSAACPAAAALTSLLLQRYGDMTQAEVVEVLKSLSLKLPGVEGYKQGWGLPILPLTDKLEILERLRNSGKEEQMANFKDVEEGRWSKEAIDFCVEKGLLIGFEDGTFRPTEPVTREQIAVILQRILNL